MSGGMYVRIPFHQKRTFVIPGLRESTVKTMPTPKADESKGGTCVESVFCKTSWHISDDTIVQVNKITRGTYRTPAAPIVSRSSSVAMAEYRPPQLLNQCQMNRSILNRWASL